MNTAKKIKLGKFEGSGREGRQASVLVDGVAVGTVERVMTYDWFGMQKKWSVEGYDIELDADESGVYVGRKTLPEVREYLKAKLGGAS